LNAFNPQGFEVSLFSRGAGFVPLMTIAAQPTFQPPTIKRNLLFLAKVLTVAAIYYAAARFGLSLAFLNASVSPVWPPTGVAIAAVWWLGYRAAPGVFLGAFLGNVLTPVSVGTAVGIATGNTLEAVTAVVLLHRFVGSRLPFDRAGDLLKFIVIAFASTTVSATIGNLSLCLGGAASWDNFPTLWLTWWLGDAVGALIVAPMILTWMQPRSERWTEQRLAEAVLLLLLLSVVSLFVFSELFLPRSSRYPLGHLIIPTMIWAAFRFGPRGAATGISVLSAIAVWGTAHGIGPFAETNPNQALLLLQAYVADIGITALVLAAIVAERQRAQRAVSFAASIVESTDDAVVGKTLAGTIISWNKAAERMYGYTAEEVIRGPISILVPPGRADDEILARLKRGEGIENYETVRVRKDGQQIDVSLTVSPIKDSSGRITGASTIARDITERKRTEQALLENREWLRMTMQGSRMGTWTRELDGTNRVQWSPELEQIFGLTPGEFPGTEEAFFDFVHPDDHEPLTQAVRYAIENHADYDIEFRYTPKGGGLRWMTGRGRAFYDADGKPYRLAGLGWDITERKRAEQERQQLLLSESAARAEAEAANRTKDEFLATLSHELRTPLNAIVGWAGMLRAGRLDQDNLSRAIEIIDRNARVQSQLIDDILDVSRIVSGKIRLDVRPVELTQVIEAAVDSIRPAAQAKNIQVHIAIDPKAGPVSADPDRLQQIVWNLLSNAVKFTPSGGEIRILARTANSNVEIVVKDSGEGIGADFLPHVFERFRQADGSLTREHKGLGLGLAIVRHLVELHGGSVKAESAGEGKGATFCVMLPLLSGRTESPGIRMEGAGVSAANGLVLSGLRILLVDDEPDARELHATILRKSAAHVQAASSGAEALEALNKSRPDILICDLEMPGMDGYSLIRRVRKLESVNGGEQIPAVALTAHVRAEDRERALKAGFQAHISKPVDPAELASVLATLAERVEKTN
jgi:PAS domain S-box-containing protein